jgi:hypothetical protein
VLRPKRTAGRLGLDSAVAVGLYVLGIIGLTQF